MAVGRDGKGGGRQQGGVGLHPLKSMVVKDFWQQQWMTNYGIGRGDDRGGQWQRVGALEAAGCQYSGGGVGQQSKAAEGGIVIC